MMTSQPSLLPTCLRSMLRSIPAFWRCRALIQRAPGWWMAGKVNQSHGRMASIPWAASQRGFLSEREVWQRLQRWCLACAAPPAWPPAPWVSQATPAAAVGATLPRPSIPPPCPLRNTALHTAALTCTVVTAPSLPPPQHFPPHCTALGFCSHPLRRPPTPL